MNRRHSAGLVLGIATIFLLAACTSSSSPGSTASSSTSNAMFTYAAFQTTMIGWDPSTAYSNEIIAMSNMYETLTRYDSQTKQVVPLLAISWSSSDQEKTWTYHLRHGVLFHTGRPMNAQAAKAAIERTIALNQGAAYIWGGVVSIDTPDAYTLVFHLKYPSAFSLITSADYAAYIYDTKAAGSENLAQWFTAGHDAGTGPYTVETYNAGQEDELTLKAFPQYWGGWTGDHYKAVLFRYVPDVTTTALLAQSGGVTFIPQLPPSLWATFNGKPGYETPQSSSWQNQFEVFNTVSGPLKNLDLRKAVSEAINYQGILAALPGVGIRTPGIIPPGLVGYNPSAPEYQYNPANAEKLLAQSGLHHVMLTLNYSTGNANEQTVAALTKSDLAAIGITLNVEGLASTTRQAIARSPNPAQRQDIFMLTWYPDYPDPYSWFVNMFKTQNPPVWNLSYYSNPTLDSQIARIEPLLAVNPAAGDALYETMQNEIYQAAVVAPMYVLNNRRVLVGDVKGYVDNPAYPDVVFVYDLTP